MAKEKKFKIVFKNGIPGSNPGFLIGMILAIFDLQVTMTLPTKFPINWPFSLGEEISQARFLIERTLAFLI